MEKLQEDVLIKFLPNTLVTVRREFGLDKPGVLKKALDDLENWVSLQRHFVKKDISRNHLERILITSKGSVEKTKLRLDKSCTIRTLLPKYFDTLDARVDIEPFDGLINFAILPQLTNDHERVIIIRTLPFNNVASLFSLYQYFIKVLEYIKINDYNSGIIVILDYTNANLKSLIPKLNVLDMRQMANIFLNHYGFRLKKIFLLCPSKIIHTFVALIKPIVPAKISKRIQVYKEYKKLYKDLPIDILPEDYEGLEKCIDDLHDDFLRVMISENFLNHLKEMKSAITDEKLRDSSEFNEKYLGEPGSLNNMIVD